MAGKLLDELLPDHSCRPENAYIDSLGLHDVLAKKNPPACGPAGVMLLAVSLVSYVTISHTPGPADSLRPLSANRLGRGAHRHDEPQYNGSRGGASN
jgi:hypothetical protein